jgi:hypothetical protein
MLSKAKFKCVNKFYVFLIISTSASLCLWIAFSILSGDCIYITTSYECSADESKYLKYSIGSFLVAILSVIVLQFMPTGSSE